MVFNGEGPTDNRFIETLTERLITKHFLREGISVELSWTRVPKVGSSRDNILHSCKLASRQDLVLVHRDADCNDWRLGLERHFQEAMQKIDEDLEGLYNRMLIPVIPVQELEAWMLCSKQTLLGILETGFSTGQLGLDYKVGRIEGIADPKSRLENAIAIIHESLPKKKRRYAIQLGDLYDSMATTLPLEDLERLDSFVRFRNALTEKLRILIDREKTK